MSGWTVGSCLCLLAASGLAWWGWGHRPGPPRLLVPEAPLHLGPGAPGEELVGALPLSNGGRQLLRIARLEAGCGCAGLHLPQETIPPGGQVLLQVAVRLRADGKPLHFPVRIYSNDPAAPVAVATVSAAAAPPPLRTDPGEISFGEVARSSRPVQHLKLLKADGTPWPASEPVTVESVRGQVLIQTTQLSRHPTAQAVLEVRPRPDLPLGPWSDTLTLRPPGSRGSAQVSIQGHVVPAVVAAPNTLYFGEVDRQSGPVHRWLVLRRTDGSRLQRIVKSTAPAGLEVEEGEPGGATAKGTTRRVRVTLNPAVAVADVKEGQLLLWLEDEPEPLAVRVLVFLRRNLVQGDR